MRGGDGRAGVTTSTDETGDDAEGTARDEQGGGAPWERLALDGEEHHEGDRRAQVIFGETHEDAEDALERLGAPQDGDDRAYHIGRMTNRENTRRP